jgi:HlyD family secretion protein
MDRAIPTRSGPSARTIVLVTACAMLVLLTYVLLNRASSARLAVDPVRLTTAEVARGEFREYYPFDGRVEPVTTVFLDVEEGGRVEEIFVKGGHRVERGDPILKFSNTTLQRSSIDTETQLLEQLDALRNTQFNRAQNALERKDQLLDLDHQILEAEKKHDRYSTLVESGGAISKEAYEQIRDELSYLKAKRELLHKRIDQEAVLTEQQLKQANDSIERLTLSRKLLARIVDSLEVRAPISGFLSSVDAEVGQSIARGQRIGQIDRLDELKVRVDVDQYYISRIEIGTPGKFDLGGTAYQVAVDKIYPEVVNDRFSVDVAFVGERPKDLRRGQRLTIELTFGAPTEELMVAKGGFFQRTGGRWVYLVAADRRSARRTPIRLGRQNPRFVEVLEGLSPGDWIVSSSYETFNEVDELTFNQPIQLLGGSKSVADAR